MIAMEGNVYFLTLKLESPVIAGFGKDKRRVVYYSLNYIPSHTLYGALSTAMFTEFCIKYPAENKCISTSCAEHQKCPVYTTFQYGLRDTRVHVTPATSICEKCKHPSIQIPSYILHCKLAKDGRCQYKDEACEYDLFSFYPNLIEGLKRNVPYAKPLWCPKGYTLSTMEIAKGWYCPTCGTKIKDIETTRITMTAIDRESRKAEEGMLFSLEAIAEGQRVSFLLASENLGFDNFIEDFIKSNKPLRIGGARSRGFGLTRIVEEDVRVENLDQYTERRAKKAFTEYNGDKILVLEAITPTFNLNIGEETVKAGMTPRVDEILNNFNFEFSQGDRTVITGWGLAIDTPRPLINAAAPGSVFYYRPVEDIDASLFKSLIYKAEVRGLEPFAKFGFNKFIIMPRKYVLRGEE